MEEIKFERETPHAARILQAAWRGVLHNAEIQDNSQATQPGNGNVVAVSGLPEDEQTRAILLDQADALEKVIQQLAEDSAEVVRKVLPVYARHSKRDGLRLVIETGRYAQADANIEEKRKKAQQESLKVWRHLVKKYPAHMQADGESGKPANLAPKGKTLGDGHVEMEVIELPLNSGLLALAAGTHTRRAAPPLDDTQERPGLSR